AARWTEPQPARSSAVLRRSATNWARRLQSQHGPPATRQTHLTQSLSHAANDRPSRHRIRCLGALSWRLGRGAAPLARDDTATVHVGVARVRPVDPALEIDIGTVALAHPVELTRERQRNKALTKRGNACPVQRLQVWRNDS